MTEEEEAAVRKRHRIKVTEGYRNGYSKDVQFQAECSCGNYRGAWKNYKGEAVQNGRMHVEKTLERMTNEGSASD